LHYLLLCTYADASGEEMSGSDEEADEDEEDGVGVGHDEAIEEDYASEDVTGEPSSSAEDDSSSDGDHADLEMSAAEAKALQQENQGREAADNHDGRLKSGRLATSSGRVGRAVSELPFTIAAPSSYEDFAQLVGDRPASELSLAVQRIRTCNALAMASDNRRKLQVCLKTIRHSGL
jgi:nucleolar protein 14